MRGGGGGRLGGDVTQGAPTSWLLLHWPAKFVLAVLGVCGGIVRTPRISARRFVAVEQGRRRGVRPDWGLGRLRWSILLGLPTGISW